MLKNSLHYGYYVRMDFRRARKLGLCILQVRKEEMGPSSIREKDLEGTAHSDVYFAIE